VSNFAVHLRTHGVAHGNDKFKEQLAKIGRAKKQPTLDDFTTVAFSDLQYFLIAFATTGKAFSIVEDPVEQRASKPMMVRADTVSAAVKAEAPRLLLRAYGPLAGCFGTLAYDAGTVHNRYLVVVLHVAGSRRSSSRSCGTGA